MTQDKAKVINYNLKWGESSIKHIIVDNLFLETIGLDANGCLYMPFCTQRCGRRCLSFYLKFIGFEINIL